MKYYGNIDLNKNFLQNSVLEMAIDFPASPVQGMLVFKDKKVFICAELAEGLPVWIQMTQEIDSFVHTQATALTTWVITHNLNTAAAIVQVMDLNGLTLTPDSIDVSVLNQTTIIFSTPQAGTAIIMLGAFSGSPRTDGANTSSLNEWHTGTSVPDPALGVDGDFYLLTTTGDVYSKTSGAYVLIANIKGADGAAGSTTSSFISASFPGALGPLDGHTRWVPPVTITLTNIKLDIDTAPTVELIMDIKKNGVSIFVGAKPTLPVGLYKINTAIASIQITPDDYLTLDIVSGNGADLTARIDYN